MPHLINDEDNAFNTNILDHTQSYYLNNLASSSSPSLSSTSSSLNSGSLTSTQGSTIAKTREELMTDIEETIEQIIISISLGEPIKLPIYTRTTSQKTKKKSNEELGNKKLRILSLSSTANAKSLARYLSVLQTIYEAIAYKIIVTKRDIFYRDVSIFGSQHVVDTIVDNISCHYNVPRSSLNVSAASKGLIFGPIIIKLRNSKVLDCMSIHTDENLCNDEQVRLLGTLIPPISQVAQVQCKAKCMIVIEKEATFRYLVSVGFCQSLPESCILVTGKGYPDLSTRQFVKYFSIHYSKLPVFALMDNDPHGLEIYATYKWGARAFAFDVLNLAVKDIELIGLKCQDRVDFEIGTECRIPLTERDRSKLAAMIRTNELGEVPGESQLRDRGWKDVHEQLSSCGHHTYMNEINLLLKSGYKLELQSLNHAGPYEMTNYLTTKLAKYKL